METLETLAWPKWKRDAANQWLKQILKDGVVLEKILGSEQ